MKYCLALADWVTEGRCNDCWGEGAGDCSWHRKCKEDNLQDCPRFVASAFFTNWHIRRGGCQDETKKSSISAR